MERTINSRNHGRRSMWMALLLLVFGLALPLTTIAHGRAVVGTAALRSTPAANAIYGPGVIHGKAHLVTNGKGTTTKIVVKVEGLKPGTTHAGHIHFGDCDGLTPGTIIHDLEPLVANAAGVATSKTVVADSLADLKDCEWWVAVHEGPVNTDPQTPAIAVGPVLLRHEAGK